MAGTFQQVGDLSLANDTKADIQDYIRMEIVPEIIGRDKDSESTLLLLHRLATAGSNPKGERKITRTMQILQASGLIAKPDEKIAHRALSDKHSSIKVKLAPNHGRGHYRLLGTVYKDGEEVKKVWLERAIAILRKGSTESSMYVAPSMEVDVLMSALGQAFDQLEQRLQTPEYIALIVAFFYTIGNKFIHPFKDGNHRAFDRFIETFFWKHGIPIELPQDESSNIPLDEIVRVWEINCLLNFLKINGLPLNFIAKTKREEDIYHARLTVGIFNLINSGLSDPNYLFFYLNVAEQFLSWVPDFDLTNIKEAIRVVQEKINIRPGKFEM
ncbi:MAG: hypothetical protein ABI721_02885 [Candidatus Dojkabacteria bacterium]